MWKSCCHDCVSKQENKGKGEKGKILAYIILLAHIRLDKVLVNRNTVDRHHRSFSYHGSDESIARLKIKLWRSKQNAQLVWQERKISREAAASTGNPIPQHTIRFRPQRGKLNINDFYLCQQCDENIWTTIGWIVYWHSWSPENESYWFWWSH